MRNQNDEVDCPRCLGTGLASYGQGDPSEPRLWETFDQECDLCGGTGLVDGYINGPKPKPLPDTEVPF